MVMSDALCKMAEQQTVLAGKSPAVQHPSLLDELQNRSAGLATAVSEAEVSLEENQSQKRESQSFKGSFSILWWHLRCSVSVCNPIPCFQETIGVIPWKRQRLFHTLYTVECRIERQALMWALVHNAVLN